MFTFLGPRYYSPSGHSLVYSATPSPTTISITFSSGRIYLREITRWTPPTTTSSSTPLCKWRSRVYSEKIDLRNSNLICCVFSRGSMSTSQTQFNEDASEDVCDKQNNQISTTVFNPLALRIIFIKFIVFFQLIESPLHSAPASDIKIAKREFSRV